MKRIDETDSHCAMRLQRNHLGIVDILSICVTRGPGAPIPPVDLSRLPSLQKQADAENYPTSGYERRMAAIADKAKEQKKISLTNFVMSALQASNRLPEEPYSNFIINTLSRYSPEDLDSVFSCSDPITIKLALEIAVQSGMAGKSAEISSGFLTYDDDMKQMCHGILTEDGGASPIFFGWVVGPDKKTGFGVYPAL